MSSEYMVENDEYYKKFVSQSSRTEKTTENYRKVLRKFCRATHKTLTDVITTCIDEQSIVTTIKLDPDENGNERRKEIKFNINSKDASINKFLKQFEDCCFKKNNKEITIQNQTDMIRSFLHENGVELPKRKSYKDDSRDWYLPSKEDFNYILQDMSLVHASLANMLTSAGMRVSDALSLSIGDFMAATSDYHDFVDVEDFIDNAPDDMIGQWIFEPQKTRKHHVKCITFNSAHTSNMILQNLRHIKNHYLPYKNRTEGLNLAISKKDPLFGSRRGKYKKPIRGRSVAAYWIEKNKKFHVWKINQIKQQIENGKISEEDYDETVSKIPHLHPHICRKFFSTIVSNNCGDIRACALLEGHSDGLPNDKSYIKKSVEDIREIYINNIHDALSLDNVETKIISDKETERLNAEIESLKEENAKLKEEKDQEISDLEQKHQEEMENFKTSINSQISQMEEKMEEKLKVQQYQKQANKSIDNLKINLDIEQAVKKYYKKHFNTSNRREYLAKCKLAHDEAVKKEDDFENTDKYISMLFSMVELRCKRNPNLIDETMQTLTQINFGEEGNVKAKRYEGNDSALKLIDEIHHTFILCPDLLELADCSISNLESIITNYIFEHQYIVDTADTLTDEEKNSIIDDILVECIRFNSLQ